MLTNIVFEKFLEGMKKAPKRSAWSLNLLVGHTGFEPVTS